MELIFTIDEFRTVVHSLRAQIEARGEQHQSAPLESLLERVLNRDFGFGIDELEILREVLERERERLKNPVHSFSGPSGEDSALTQRALERVIDKVVEACAMV